MDPNHSGNGGDNVHQMTAACKYCNSIGTTSCSKLNGGKCECSIGYSGALCETCEEGYHISSEINGENVCSGE